MKKCTVCGANLNKDDQVCPGCGSEVVKEKKKGSAKAVVIVIVTIFVLLMVFGIFGGLSAPVRGYYNYDNKPYYFQNGVWYTYSEFGGWYARVPDAELTNNYKEYYEGNTYADGSSYDSFEDSEYYLGDGVGFRQKATEKE